jgi:nucleoside-diphosphate-sugar epimerase
MAVYEPLPDGVISESTHAAPPDRLDYAQSKLATENEVLRYAAERSVAAVVIQPTLVYGPFLDYWTMQELKHLREGKVVLPAGDLGLCNAVYVDDVVDALLLAVETPEAVGERFLISSEEPVPWRDFYEAYERALGVDAVTLMPLDEIERLNRKTTAGANLRMLLRDPRWLLRWAPVQRLYHWARHHVDDRWWKRAKRAVPVPWYVPDTQRLDLYLAKARIDISKARDVLGYRPAFTFERGMALTAEFVRWAQL